MPNQPKPQRMKKTAQRVIGKWGFSTPHAHLPDDKGYGAMTDPDLLIRMHASPILDSNNFKRTDSFVQHGTTSCRSHCIAVARLSLALAGWFHVRHDPASLIRGALLHDFFLYDWHEKQPTSGLHGYTHPKRALENALLEFEMNAVEQEIILRHMFPLTVIPPRRAESWLVCLADKICSLAEIIRLEPIEFLFTSGIQAES